MLIAYLDALDGDPDIEDDGQDRCAAGDDAGTAAAAWWSGDDLLPGDPVDAEEDHMDHPRPTYGEAASQDPADHPAYRHLFWHSA